MSSVSTSTGGNQAGASGPDRLFGYMVSLARYRDNVYFGSDETAANTLGVCRRTVIRWRQQLEASGRIERCGWKRWAVGKRTVIYRLPTPRVTRRLRRSNPSLTGLRTNRSGSSFACERTASIAKALATDHVEFRRAGSGRAESARDVIRTVCATFAGWDIAISSRDKGMIGRRAKELLAAGYDFEVVVLASVTAMRLSEPWNLDHVARDLMLTMTGLLMTRREYEQALEVDMEVGGSVVVTCEHLARSKVQTLDPDFHERGDRGAWWRTDEINHTVDLALGGDDVP